MSTRMSNVGLPDTDFKCEVTSPIIVHQARKSMDLGARLMTESTFRVGLMFYKRNIERERFQSLVK